MRKNKESETELSTREFRVTCLRSSRVFRLHNNFSFSLKHSLPKRLQNQRHMRESCSCHQFIQILSAIGWRSTFVLIHIRDFVAFSFLFRLKLNQFIYRNVMQVKLRINLVDGHLNWSNLKILVVAIKSLIKFSRFLKVGRLWKGKD